MLDTPASRFSIVNLGCKVNRVESDTIAARLTAAGGTDVDMAFADVIFVNTCTVTGEADKKARKAVRAALRANPRAEIVVTGCGVAVDADAFRRISPRVNTIGRAELLESLPFGDGGALRMGNSFRTRVNLKVQDGCDHACTYCIVHVARGPARSMPFEEVIGEAGAYFARGAKELVLTGIDLGSYRDGRRGLAELVEALLEQADGCCGAGERPARVRVSSIEPMSLEERLVELLASAEGRLCRHLHLPLQSGSSAVLHQMARPYSAGRFTELVAHLYERVPQLSLTTDAICGFPGESDDDFGRTLEVARRCRFSRIHVFPYSKRPGTPAAGRANQVPDDVKAARATRLRALARELSAADLRRRSGATELALVEGATAISESYHELPAPHGADPGQLVPVMLDYNG